MAEPDPSIGPLVVPGPARRPERITLSGRFVTLEPLQESHAADLFAAAGGAAHGDLWAYMPDGPFPDLASLSAVIARKAASADPLFYAIRARASGRVLGHAGLMRMDLPNRAIEVGNIMFGEGLQRSPGATESMALLARYVFDELGFRRYEWKCNALNAPSRSAAARLGFTFEGIFRQHMIVKNRNRDTAWFSMLDGEWPACRAAFELWLAPENFDAEGRQRRSLAALRGPTA
jgi:RimJ/RimL family protein N-acetyltransferase